MKARNFKIVEAPLLCLLLPVSFFSIIVSVSSGETATVWGVCFVLSLATFFIASLLTLGRVLSQRNLAPALLPPLSALILIASVAITNWPLHTAYRYSKEAIDQFADRVRAGEQVETPARLGLFIIQRGEITKSGRVCLWTDLNPKGYTGFGQYPVDNLPGNLWTWVNLDERWQFIAQD